MKAVHKIPQKKLKNLLPQGNRKIILKSKGSLRAAFFVLLLARIASEGFVLTDEVN